MFTFVSWQCTLSTIILSLLILIEPNEMDRRSKIQYQLRYSGNSFRRTIYLSLSTKRNRRNAGGGGSMHYAIYPQTPRLCWWGARVVCFRLRRVEDWRKCMLFGKSWGQLKHIVKNPEMARSHASHNYIHGVIWFLTYQQTFMNQLKCILRKNLKSNKFSRNLI